MHDGRAGWYHRRDVKCQDGAKTIKSGVIFLEVWKKVTIHNSTTLYRIASRRDQIYGCRLDSALLRNILD